MRYYWFLLLIAVACVSCVTLAEEPCGSPAVAQLKLEKRVDLPGKADRVIGSLFSPNATYSLDGSHRALITTPDPKSTRREVDTPWAVYPSRNGRYVVIDVLENPDNPDGAVISTLYELPAMRKLWTRKGPSAVALISDDGRTVVFHNVDMLSYPTLEFYDEKGRCVRSYVPHENRLGLVALAPSGAFVLVGAGTSPAADARITMYDRSGREMTVFDPRMGPIGVLEISPDETRVVAHFRLISHEPKAQMYLLDAQLNEITAENPGTHALSRVVFSPDSTCFAVALAETLQLRDGATGKTLWEQPRTKLVGAAKWNRIALSKGGEMIAISASTRPARTSSELAESSLTILDRSGKVIGRLDRGTRAPFIEQMEFSADGRTLAAHIKGDGIEYYSVPMAGGAGQ